MNEINEAFRRRGVTDSPLHLHLAPMIEAFARSGCADTNYLSELASGEDGPFWSRVWEAMLYCRFHKLGWIISGLGAGPDFSVETPNGAVLVEATVPSPEGLPSEWLSRNMGQVYSMPHEQMLLRWTSKLSDKRQKHLDDIANGRACADTPFVIAINSCRLGRFPEENGISQWPFAVEATFPIGPLAVPVDRATGKFGETYQSLRFSVTKRPGVDIPTGNFMDPNYSCVSALVGCAACYADESTREKFCGQPPFFVVHNPLATNKLSTPWLPGSIEYVAVKTSDDEYQLSRCGAERPTAG